jgi:uncharacterized membrane protein
LGAALPASAGAAMAADANITEISALNASLIIRIPKKFNQDPLQCSKSLRQRKEI